MIFPGVRLRVLMLTICVVWAACVTSSPAATSIQSAETKEWYLCTLAKDPCGWMSSSVITTEDSRMYTTRLSLQLRRDSAQVKSLIESRIEEGIDGSVREMVAVQELGKDRVEQRWFFLPDRIRVLVKNGRRQRTNTLALPQGDWRSTEDALRQAIRVVGDGSEVREFICQVLDPSLGEVPKRTVYTWEGTENMSTSRGEFECVRWRVEHEGSPVERIWLDTTHRLIRSVASLGKGFGDLEIVLATQEEATAKRKGPEIVIRSAVEPVLAEGLPRILRRTKRMRVRVTGLDGRPLMFPSIGHQRVFDDGTVCIHVSTGSPPDDVEGDYLGSTLFCDREDERIIEFAQRNIHHRNGSQSKAESLRSAVNRHISSKGLSTAFASASETIRSRKGDCSEHAVLLAAVLRATNIPARVVNGLVYVRNGGPEGRDAYVWHMWTQALIDGTWKDFDATLRGPLDFHAAYLAVSVNDLSQASLNASSTEMLKVLGNLHIEIIEAESIDP